MQVEYASPAKVTKAEVENFRQKILETDSKRNYAIVTLMAYSGMRISEALSIRLDDINLIGREILLRKGKGEKQRVVIINDKCVNAMREYLKERETLKYKDSELLFVGRENGKVDRTTINHIFNNTTIKSLHTL